MLQPKVLVRVFTIDCFVGSTAGCKSRAESKATCRSEMPGVGNFGSRARAGDDFDADYPIRLSPDQTFVCESVICVHCAQDTQW